MKKSTVQLQSVLEKWEYSNKIISGGVVAFSLDGVLYHATLSNYTGGWFIKNTMKVGGSRYSTFSLAKERYIADKLIEALGWKENNDLLSLGFKLEELRSKGAIDTENENPWFTTIKFYVNDIGLNQIKESQVVQGRLERDANYRHAVCVPIVHAEYILGGTLITVYESEIIEVEKKAPQKLSFTSTSNTKYLTVSEACDQLQDLIERGFSDEIVFVSDGVALTAIQNEHDTVFLESMEYDEEEDEEYYTYSLESVDALKPDDLIQIINKHLSNNKDFVIRLGDYHFATYECKSYAFGKFVNGDLYAVGGLKDIATHAGLATDIENTFKALIK